MGNAVEPLLQRCQHLGILHHLIRELFCYEAKKHILKIFSIYFKGD